MLNMPTSEFYFWSVSGSFDRGTVGGMGFFLDDDDDDDCFRVF